MFVFVNLFSEGVCVCVSVHCQRFVCVCVCVLCESCSVCVLGIKRFPSSELSALQVWHHAAVCLSSQPAITSLRGESAPHQ